MAITIGSNSYSYLRDAINAAVNNDVILVGAGTYNILDYTSSAPQNVNVGFCGSYAPSLSRFFTGKSGINGLTIEGAVDGTTGAPLATITNITRIYAGAKDRGYGLPTKWTINNLALQFNVTSGSEYILQGGNYGSLTNNLTDLTLKNVIFQGTHVGSSGGNGVYCDLIAANNLTFDQVKVGSNFGGQQTYVAGTTTTMSSGGSAFLFAQGNKMLVQDSSFVETGYGNSITFWGSTDATLTGNLFDGDGQIKQRGQILSNTSAFTTGVDSNLFVGGTHLDLIDVGGLQITASNNSFDAKSINTPSASVTKGIGIVISSTTVNQTLEQARKIMIKGNDFKDVNPIVVQLSGQASGASARTGTEVQLTFDQNRVYNPVISSFTTFGRFIIGGTSDDVLTGAMSTSKNDFISGAQGNDTLTGNGGDDAFVFAFQPGTANNNVDTITDFKATGRGADKIWLDDSVFTALSKGALGGSFGTKINFDATTKCLFYDPTGSGSTTETGSTLKVANFTGISVTPIASDFVVF